MLQTVLRFYSAQYTIRNGKAVARTLQNLPEFQRTRLTPEGEDFIWVAPRSRGVAALGRPVATVRLRGETLSVHCESQPALRAMQVLLDILMGAELARISSEAAPLNG